MRGCFSPLAEQDVLRIGPQLDSFFWHGGCASGRMENESAKSQFPKTTEDVSKLKQTASDAASDLGEAASEHASRAKKQIKELAGDATQEGQQQLEKVKGNVDDVVEAARDYFQSRPLLCLGIAFALGMLFARRGGNDD